MAPVSMACFVNQNRLINIMAHIIWNIQNVTFKRAFFLDFDFIGTIDYELPRRKEIRMSSSVDIKFRQIICGLKSLNVEPVKPLIKSEPNRLTVIATGAVTGKLPTITGEI